LDELSAKRFAYRSRACKTDVICYCVLKLWTEILKRIIAVIRFLAERGLSFHSTNEVIGSPDNKNLSWNHRTLI